VYEVFDVVSKRRLATATSLWMAEIEARHRTLKGQVVGIRYIPLLYSQYKRPSAARRR